jgi:hypothetical protein
MTGMPENRPDRLKKLQTAFAAHIRDPENQAAPAGIEDRRMKIYRDLFFNNISSLLASNFPVLHSIYDDAGWRKLVRDFYSEHRCQTPLFPEVSREFLHYLQDVRKTCTDDPGFLLELAHYEWVELALSLDERNPFALATEGNGGLLNKSPVLSPLAWPLSYRYPVHLIGPDFQPATPPDEPTHLLVYRNREDRVKFMKLNSVSRILLEMMQEDREATGLQLLGKVADAIGHPNPERVIASGATLLNEWKDKGVLLGDKTDV